MCSAFQPPSLGFTYHAPVTSREADDSLAERSQAFYEVVKNVLTIILSSYNAYRTLLH
jgi:hypothetical protein